MTETPPSRSQRLKSYVYHVVTRWDRDKKGMQSASGKPDWPVASPPEFGGHEGIWSPEDMFVAAVNGCLMMTFLFFASQNGIGLVSYESSAEGVLEKTDQGLAFTKISVSPKIKVTSAPEMSKAQETLMLAKKYCLVSNSIRSEVTVSPDILVAV